MGAHPKTFARFAGNIRAHPRSTDYWLDRWLDARDRASEWDACQWGFDPVRWMDTERTEMRCLAAVKAAAPRHRPPWVRP